MNAIFVGEKRSGKTTLAFHIALNPVDYDAGRINGSGTIVFDPKKEFRGWPATVSSISELEHFAKKHRIIVWRPGTNEDVNESFNKLADWILAKHDYALSKGWDKTGYNFTLLIDEAYNLQSHAWINEKLLRILSQCRPEILNVFQTFQSVKNVNSDSRSRVSDWFLFTITLKKDLDRLQEFATEDVIEQVKTLPEHEYVHFLNEKGSVESEIVTDSAEWFEPLDYEGKKKIMARDEQDERDEFPKDGIRIMDRGGLDEANQKFNRRKKDDPKTKNRTRRSDRQEESGNGNRGGGKEIVFGGRKSA